MRRVKKVDVSDQLALHEQVAARPDPSASTLLPEGTPEVDHPPAKAAAPKCGTQRTVTIPGAVTPRLRQTLY